MYLEIISPEKTLFKGEVESVLFPGTYGDFQVLNNHAPIVSTLTKGKVKILGNIYVDKDVKDKFLSRRQLLFPRKKNTGGLVGLY